MNNEDDERWEEIRREAHQRGKNASKFVDKLIFAGIVGGTAATYFGAETLADHFNLNAVEKTFFVYFCSLAVGLLGCYFAEKNLHRMYESSDGEYDNGLG